jgi:hypothetical protein
MAKLEHKNLFAFGDKAEVYAALQRDYNRDTYVHQLWHFVILGAAVGAGLFSNHWDWHGTLRSRAGTFALHRQQ